jgi:mannitol/fructose-specific phosphotransferase system IIA component (Ntr-type)
VLARLSRLIGDPTLLETLRQASDADEAYRAIAEREGRLT